MTTFLEAVHKAQAREAAAAAYVYRCAADRGGMACCARKSPNGTCPLAAEHDEVQP